MIIRKSVYALGESSVQLVESSYPGSNIGMFFSFVHVAEHYILLHCTRK